MLFASLLSLVLMATCVVIHYEALQRLHAVLPRTHWLSPRPRVILAMLGAIASHLSQIALFAFAYYLLRDKFGLGQFGGQFEDSYSNFLYFSTETYSTLGLGDIYPIGTLRMVMGIETLTGLLMISWTASFSYLEMRRFW